jgi:hypothetical protein
MRHVWNWIRKYLAGRSLEAARRRNNEAADRLDAALREVFKR